jgi:hypothetical protein
MSSRREHARIEVERPPVSQAATATSSFPQEDEQEVDDDQDAAEGDGAARDGYGGGFSAMTDRAGVADGLVGGSEPEDGETPCFGADDEVGNLGGGDGTGVHGVIMATTSERKLTFAALPLAVSADRLHLGRHPEAEWSIQLLTLGEIPCTT